MSKSTTTTDTTVLTNDSNKAEYEAQLPEILKQEMGATAVCGNMPIIMIDNGERLYNRAVKDKAALLAAGLAEETLVNLKEAAGACRYAISELIVAMEHTGKWQKESPQGYQRCDTIKYALLYALRAHPELLKIVREMSKGTSNRAMVQNLQDYSTFGNAHRDLLEQIKFDMSLLDEAAKLSAYLGNLLGSTEIDAAVEARIIRDKSYYYLKKLVKEVRACGQYVFRNDKAQLEEYSGPLFPKKAARRKKEETVATEESALSQAA
ncbi:MAG: hypothetical protein JW863_13470 [Chitinispirillaceae bacterium]|nr:hypothetical protein [Chitinispirillaceae bacterium]